MQSPYCTRLEQPTCKVPRVPGCLQKSQRSIRSPRVPRSCNSSRIGHALHAHESLGLQVCSQRRTIRPFAVLRPGLVRGVEPRAWHLRGRISRIGTQGSFRNNYALVFVLVHPRLNVTSSSNSGLEVGLVTSNPILQSAPGSLTALSMQTTSCAIF